MGILGDALFGGYVIIQVAVLTLATGLPSRRAVRHRFGLPSARMALDAYML